METAHASASVLVALFDLARLGVPADVHRIAGRIGLGVAEARAALRHLEARGLADAMRARLTLRGLAAAASLAAERDARGAALATASGAAAERPARRFAA